MATASKHTISSVNIRPEVTILSVLRHLNYRPWFALAEFVDNALGSYLTHKKEIRAADGTKSKLIVEIEVDSEDPGQIVIRDNAGGILEKEFPRAFRPAELPPDRSGLSEFGMGMKSAACWFSKEWIVRTSALNDPVERTVLFDMDRILASREDKIDIKKRTIPANSHFTEIVLRNLYHPPKGRTLAKIKEHLASIYRVYLRDGSLVLKFDGEELHYDSVAILKASPHKNLDKPPVVWKKEIDFDFGQGQKVTGFAALRERASTTHAGFALFRRDRLIEGSADETYRPIQIFGNSNSYRYQRLFGELHLEGFDVSHTKDGFRWGEYEEVFLELLKEELERSPLNLLDQAEGHRTREARKDAKSEAQSATDHVAEVVKKDVPDVLEKEAEDPSTPEPIEKDIPTSKLQTSEKTVRIENNNQVWDVTIRTTTDPAVGQWLRLSDVVHRKEQALTVRCITIDVGFAHPFSVQFLGANDENLELLLRMATGISLALIMAADATGTSPAFALHHLNTLLRDALSHV